MIIDIRTRLPHGHLVNKAHDVRFHAGQLAKCAAELRAVNERLREVLKDVQAFRNVAEIGS